MTSPPPPTPEGSPSEREPTGNTWINLGPNVSSQLPQLCVLPVGLEALEQPLGAAEANSFPREATCSQNTVVNPATACRPPAAEVALLDSAAGVTCAGPVHRPQTRARPAAGQRPSGSRAPRQPGQAQPMGWQRPHDPRRQEGVGKQAGRARCRAVSPPSPPSGREVSCPGPQRRRASESVLQPAAARTQGEAWRPPR